MLDKLDKIEKISRRLEPSSSMRHTINTAVLTYAKTFLTRLPETKAYTLPEASANPDWAAPIGDEPVQIETLLNLLAQHLDRPGINTASAGHLGYIPGGGIYSAALGDYLAAVTNRYAGVYFASPGAVQLENMLIKWMAELVGYPKNAGGALLSGGSIANLTAIVTARDAAGLKSADIPRSAIYLSAQAHHSIGKALRIAGLAEIIVREVEMDDSYRMKPDALAAAIAADRKAGLNPWLVTAAAGTTDTGMIDPLADVGEIAENEQLWYHIDGAYGAFFALCNPGRKALRGMENSHSLVMDPHKTLFLPYGSGAVLVKDRQSMMTSHHYFANYMQDTEALPSDISPADVSPELSKHFRGLRMWLPLKLHGLAPFRAALEEKLLLAQYFYEKIQEIDGFEVGPYPDLSVVVYRYVPAHGDADAFNRRLVEEIHKDGRVFISTTVLNGHFTLRMAAVVFRTHIDTIDLLLEILREKSRMLANQ